MLFTVNVTEPFHHNGLNDQLNYPLVMIELLKLDFKKSNIVPGDI